MIGYVKVTTNTNKTCTTIWQKRRIQHSDCHWKQK